MSILKTSFWLNLIFPISCLACGYDSQKYLCDSCFKTLNFKGELKERYSQYIDHTFAIASYKDKLAPLLIHAYKFKAAKAISDILAEYLRIFWQSRTLFFKENYIVFPIPLSKQGYRRRGFNQTELIAKIFTQQFNYTLNLNLKRKNRQAQSRLNSKRRASNVLNAFYYTGQNLAGANIIILDDVLTTGATAGEAARILKEAGAGAVLVIAIFKS